MGQKFFISFNSADRTKPHWIAWTLKEAGHEVAVHDWEIPAGGNAPLWMNTKLAWADRLIAVISPDYVPARYSPMEWTSQIWNDPDGTKGSVIPVIVKPTSKMPPLLKGLSRIDLMNCSEDEARRRLINGVDMPAPPPKPAFEKIEGEPPDSQHAGPAEKPTFVQVQIGNLFLGEKAPQVVLDFLKGLTRGHAASSTDDGIQKLLNLVQRWWVDEVLDKGLLLGNTPAEVCFAAVDKPATRTSVNSLTEIAKESNYSLLILGDAGAGKTTALLLFLREILSANQPDAALLPVVFSLRNWTSKSGGFEKWLRSQLLEAPYKIGADLVDRVLANEKLLLLCDGLDEAETVSGCTSSLLSYIRDRRDIKMIVTCRSQGWPDAPGQHPFRRMIQIQPLTRDALIQFAKNLGPRFKGFENDLAQNQSLADVCATPLFLRLASSVYSGPNAPSLGEEVTETRLFHSFFSGPQRLAGESWSHWQTLNYLANIVVFVDGLGTLYLDETGNTLIGRRWPDGLEDRRRNRQPINSVSRRIRLLLHKNAYTQYGAISLTTITLLNAAEFCGGVIAMFVMSGFIVATSFGLDRVSQVGLTNAFSNDAGVHFVELIAFFSVMSLWYATMVAG
jgi:hypothetical protein